MIKVNNLTIKAFIDSGACVTLISHEVFLKLYPKEKPPLLVYDKQLLDANGNKIPVLGMVDTQVSTPNGKYWTTVVLFVKDNAIEHDLLLGMNILVHTSINFSTQRLTFHSESINQAADKERATGMSLQFNFMETQIQGVHRQTMEHKPGQLRVNVHNKGSTEDTSQDNDGTLQHTAEEGCVPNGKEPTVTSSSRQERDARQTGSEADALQTRREEEASLEKTTTGSAPPVSLYLVQPITIDANCITVTTAKINQIVLEQQDICLSLKQLTPNITLPHLCTRVKDNQLTLGLANIGDSKYTIPAGTKLGVVEYLHDQTVPPEGNHICSAHEKQASHDPKQGDKIQTEPSTETALRQLTLDDLECDNVEMKPELLKVLNKRRTACWLPGEPLGLYTRDKLEIKLKSKDIVNKQQYKIPYAYQEQLKEAVDQMQKDGIIELSKSSYNSPLLIVKRPDGKIRPVLDYRELNKRIEPVKYPLPRIPDLLNALGQAKYISTLDLPSAFHQCEISEVDKHLTAFTVGSTKYQFTKIPFGLQSSPAFFARIINSVLYEEIGTQCLAYMDDIIVYSTTVEEHLRALDNVLGKLTEANIKIKVEKCRFFANEVKFLGYQVNKDGMTMDRQRIEAIKAMPMPTSKRQLQAFLGVANYFRVFVPHFASIAEPLYSLLRKHVRFQWTQAQTQAVEILKQKLASAPIVKFPNYHADFHLHTDASETGMGATLMQEYGGLLHPVAYISKTLNSAQRNYSVTKKEALALVFALEELRHMVLGFPIHVYTDHKPLLGALQRPTKDQCLQRWSLLVQEYDIKLYYLEGSKNVFADTLSRLPQTPKDEVAIDAKLDEDLIARNALCNHIQEYIPEKTPWTLRELRNAQRKDPACINIRNHLRDGTKPENNDKQISSKFLLDCKVINDVLYIVRKIKRATLYDQFIVPWVPDSLIHAAFKTIHGELSAGHRGAERSLKLFVKNFYHPNERKIIHDLCDRCEICVKVKGTPKPVPIATFPVPTRPFHTIASDIMGPLRMTERGNRYILTFRDYTTRYTVLFPLPYKSTEEIISALRQVISNFGSPHVLMTDNAAEYTSEKLRDFLSFYNTRKVEIAPFHPIGNGISERINYEVAKILRTYVDQLAMNDWDQLLPAIQLTINNTFNASINESPFFALFSFDSATISLNPPKLSYSEDELLQHMRRVGETRIYCRNRLLKAQARYTNYTNAGRLEKNIKVGDRVYARITKHRPLHQKLDIPISGPFVVLKNKGKAWELKELATKKTFVVHPDFIILSAAAQQPRAREKPFTSETDSDDSETEGYLTLDRTSGTPVTQLSQTLPAGTESIDTTKPVPPTRRVQPPRECKNRFSDTAVTDYLP